jgi:hypothetical protein
VKKGSAMPADPMRNAGFRSGAGEECRVVKAGKVIINVPGTPFSINAAVVGTEIIARPQSAARSFHEQSADGQEPPEWPLGVFVGRHWLFGDFKMDLGHQRPSVGPIGQDPATGSRLRSEGEHNLSVSVRLRRFPNLKIGAAPPVTNHNPSMSCSPPIIAKERDVENVPQRNVMTRLVSMDRVGMKYRVKVRVRNLSDQNADFAYFNLLHIDGLNSYRDYGFFSLPGAGERIVKFSMASTIGDRQIDIPFFATLYRPRGLQGFHSTLIRYAF